MSEPTKDIILVTCERWPDLSTGDSVLADELRTRGHRVRGLPWNVAPLEAFTSADLIVLRSNWDFHNHLPAFATWLDDIEASGVPMRNSAGLVRGFLDKTYLEPLAAAGFRTPQTLIIDDLDVDVVTDWMNDHQFDRVVTKPVWGASGHGVSIVDVAGLAELAASRSRDADRRALLVQEFIPSVSNGEIALVYFKGEYSHALLRRPAAGDFRVNSQYGGTMTALDHVDPALIELGHKVDESLAEVATYVRIDVVSDGVDHVVMEVEVNEPALGLHLSPGSAGRFADALLS
ncbi:MAG: ATP-grasp domain-containing protein [Actinomycetota bacterium]